MYGLLNCPDQCRLKLNSCLNWNTEKKSVCCLLSKSCDAVVLQWNNCRPTEKLEDVLLLWNVWRHSVLMWKNVSSSHSSDMEGVCVWLVCVCMLGVCVGAHSSLDRGDHAHLDHQHHHPVSNGNAASGRTHTAWDTHCHTKLRWWPLDPWAC